MIEPHQQLVESHIDDLPISAEERHALHRLQKTGRRLEMQNAELLQRLQDKASDTLRRYELDPSLTLAGENLKDVLSIADATTRFTKSIREDENIRAKLARKAVGKKKVDNLADMGLPEVKALLTAISKVYSAEQIAAMIPVTVEQD